MRPPLFAYLSGLPSRAEYPVARWGAWWQLQGGSYAELRHDGTRWVAVEVPRNAPAGIYLSVFTQESFANSGL